MNKTKLNKLMRKTMKLKLRLSLFLSLLTFFVFSNESFALTDYQIKIYCEKKKREFSCRKDLQEKRSNLQTGKPIEIPVIPHKR